MSDADAPLTRDTGTADELAPLFDSERAQNYRSRWASLQARFVDDPRSTVEEADGLVKDLLDDLSSSDERASERGRGRVYRGPPPGTSAVPIVLPASARRVTDGETNPA